MESATPSTARAWPRHGSMDLIKSGDVTGGGYYDTFVQGCTAVEMALHTIRKEAIPEPGVAGS